ARKSPLYTQFAGRFGSAFDHRAPGNLAEFAYDAAYLLFYAIAISGEAYPTGPELADALTKVTCKGDGSTDTTVKVGPTGFGGYFTTAASTQCIDFEGASGELDFDNQRGEATSDIAMWCL